MRGNPCLEQNAPAGKLGDWVKQVPVLQTVMQQHVGSVSIQITPCSKHLKKKEAISVMIWV